MQASCTPAIFIGRNKGTSRCETTQLHIGKVEFYEIKQGGGGGGGGGGGVA